MVLFVGVLAALQMLGAVTLYFVLPSPAHAVLAVTLFGAGVISFALGVLIERADKQNELLERIANKV